MINLLPPKEKQNLAAEEQKKTILILGLVTMIFAISLILILSFVDFTVAAQLKSQNVLLQNTENEFERSGIQDTKNLISQANKNLANLDSFYTKKPSMTNFLEEVSALLPSGIYLNNISVSPLGSDENTFQVVLSGHADSRDDVTQLNDNLGKSDKFSNPVFPPDTWINKQNFDFSVTFKATI